LTQHILHYGLFLVFALIAVEGAGVPLPGETALIAASILASNGHYSIGAVIAVGAAAAITGDNTGYWLGRLGGRRLLHRLPLIRSAVERLLPRAESFFHRHGAKTVFVARFVALLRITAAWMAGISHMPWRRFFLFDAAGGILWATVVSVIAYYFGRAAANAITHYGVYAAIAIGVVVVAGFVALQLWERRKHV
jgi:membrane protein DedA with SNARE-associated domain